MSAPRGVPPGLLLVDCWDDTLERAVRDAAATVDTPIALVSLFTERLQVFAAHVGLPPELEVSRATSRDVSFDRLIVDQGVLEVPDVLEHPELRPELTDSFGVRAWLGVPLVVAGQVVGALCVLDTRPRPFGAESVARLQQLAQVVEHRLAARAAEPGSPAPGPLGPGQRRVDVATAELLPYLRLLQAVQLGGLSPEAMTRALRVLPPVPFLLAPAGATDSA